MKGASNNSNDLKYKRQRGHERDGRPFDRTRSCSLVFVREKQGEEKTFGLFVLEINPHFTNLHIYESDKQKVLNVYL